MERYKRQINLPQIGKEGQQKLFNSSILVVGAGGLGSAVLPYLSASGIGTIGIIDGDRIEKSNLQRQVLFSEDSIGELKVNVTASKLRAINSDTNIKIYNEFLNPENAISIIKNYDIIVDATDSVAIRYLINDACFIANKPFVYGSVYRFEGQVSVFNFKNGPTYRCLFKEKKTQVINCEEAGVLGTTVGLIGMLQGIEVMKMILETGDVLSGKLLIYNTLKNRQNIIHFKKDNSIQVDLEFYNTEYFKDHLINMNAKEAVNSNATLIDVREYGELPEINSDRIIKLPLSQIEANISLLSKELSYAVFCQQGVRSFSATTFLKKHGFKNVKNIKDGASVIKNLLENEKEKSIH